METLLTILEYVVDLVLLLPPLEAVEAWGISPETSRNVLFAALVVCLFGIFHQSVGNVFGQSQSAKTVVLALLVCGLAVAGWSKAEREIVAASWMALVFAVRFVEGATLGSLVRQRPMTLGLLLAIVPLGAALYLGISGLDRDGTAIVKTAWILGASLAAAAGLLRTLRRNDADHGDLSLSSGVAGFGVFLAFASSTLYVDATPSLSVIHVACFPAGLLLGLVVGPERLGQRDHPK